MFDSERSLAVGNAAAPQVRVAPLSVILKQTTDVLRFMGILGSQKMVYLSNSGTNSH